MDDGPRVRSTLRSRFGSLHLVTRWVLVGAVVATGSGLLFVGLLSLAFPGAAGHLPGTVLQVVLYLGLPGAAAGLCLGAVDHVLGRYVERQAPDGRAVWVATAGIFVAVLVALVVGPWYAPQLLPSMLLAAVPTAVVSRRYRRLSLGGGERAA